MMISQKNIRSSACLLLCLYFNQGFASTPSMTAYFGLGGSYTTLQSNPSFNLLDGEGGSIAFNGREKFPSAVNPYFQMGYLHTFDTNGLFGMHFDYTYLNAQANSASTIGHQQLEYTNLLKFLLQIGLKPTQKTAILLGVGPNEMNHTLSAHVEDGPVAGNINDKNWSWGVTGALDYLQYFTSAVFLDLGYAYSYNAINEAINDPIEMYHEGIIGAMTANNRYAAVQSLTASINYAF